MKLLTKLLLSATLVVTQVAASAQDGYPSKPVTIIVPYGPGGGVGVFIQALAEGMRAEWKQSVIVDYKPGANEIVGATFLIRAQPDGYTIMASTEAAPILNPSLFKKLPYDPDKQMVPVSLLVKAPLVLVVPASSQANTMKQFVEMAKARSATDPVRYGSGGAGGTGHLPFVALASDNNLTLIHAAYKGGGPLLQDLLGGFVEAGLLGSAVAEPHVKSGKLKALAVTADKRLSSMPNVPLFPETGVQDINATFIVALSASTGTPANIIANIAHTAKKVMSSPEFQTKTLDASALLQSALTQRRMRTTSRNNDPFKRRISILQGSRWSDSRGDRIFRGHWYASTRKRFVPQALTNSVQVVTPRRCKALIFKGISPLSVSVCTINTITPDGKNEHPAI
ncbi:tripartite tricarboxylate transporter substrate binding protein [Polaromonas sp. P1-6]|nr:tripartite tricarboxylate transporter substrate binding protein [Polaromonas sp. P1-6]